jgi:hypothetical protein
MVQIAEWWTREEVKKTILSLSPINQDGAPEQVASRPTPSPATAWSSARRPTSSTKDLFDALGVTITGKREVMTHKVTQRLVSGADVLETVDWAGKYIPIVPVFGEELYVEGKRILRSLIRGAHDAQRMFNYWRSNATEMAGLGPKTPFIGKKGTFDYDQAKWATINTQAHAYVEYEGPEAPGRPEPPQVPAAAIQMSEQRPRTTSCRSSASTRRASARRRTRTAAWRSTPATAGRHRHVPLHRQPQPGDPPRRPDPHRPDPEGVLDAADAPHPEAGRHAADRGGEPAGSGRGAWTAAADRPDDRRADDDREDPRPDRRDLRPGGEGGPELRQPARGQIKAYDAETDRLKVIIGNQGTQADPQAMAQVVMHSLLTILQSPDILDGMQAGGDPQAMATMLAQRMGGQGPQDVPAPASPSPITPPMGQAA